MIDPAYCRDLVILQAIIFVIMYLQGTGRLSHCYSYLALASGSAFQMGIHRNYTPPHLDLVQVEITDIRVWQSAGKARLLDADESNAFSRFVYNETRRVLPGTVALHVP